MKTEEFNLSSKIHGDGIGKPTLEWINLEDVKEFIKKEDGLIWKLKQKIITIEQFEEEREKLAGEELQ